MIDVHEIDPAQASSFVRLALRGLTREWPNKLDHVMNDAADVLAPRRLHPAFYGCFDWHSAVHGHWLLVRVLRLLPALPEAPACRAVLDRHLTAENIQAELSYLAQENRQSFERTYGWAWLLKLAEEIAAFQDPDAARWGKALGPLAEEFAIRFRAFLPRQTYPIRTGVHPNTAFGLAFALDYARAVGDQALEKLVVARARAFFENDRDYPAAWEPSGEDFFSPALMEADLMRRVLDPAAFIAWFHRFLPGLSRGEPRSLLEPATVADRSDGKLVHLDGLNLSRAACMRSIAPALPVDDPAREVLRESAARHARAGLAGVESGDYAGEHWLATFAVYMLSTPA